MLSFSLRCVLSRFLRSSKSSGGRHKGWGRPRLPLRLEELEQRTVPSTFVVTTTNDSGPGSLRQAILDANTAPGTNTVTFNLPPGVQTISPTEALPQLNSPVVLDGA